MHEGHKEIYECAIENIKRFGWKKSDSIYNTLKSFLKNKKPYEKICILGEEIYLDYIVYKKRIDEGKFKSFMGLFNSFLLEHNHKSREEKEEFLKSYTGLSPQCMENIALAKIAEEHFSKKFETYINYDKFLRSESEYYDED